MGFIGIQSEIYCHQEYDSWWCVWKGCIVYIAHLCYRICWVHSFTRTHFWEDDRKMSLQRSTAMASIADWATLVVFRHSKMICLENAQVPPTPEIIWEAFHSPFSSGKGYALWRTSDLSHLLQDPSSREESVTSIKNLLKGLLDSISSHLDLMMTWWWNAAAFSWKRR